MTDIQFGAVREVWLSTLTAPNTHFSFLVRDDSFAKSGVVFGRTQRLGDPLSLGPGSGWRQLSWEGGKGQFEWRDQQMFESGNADVFSRTGKIRMWPGWASIKKEARRVFDRYTLARGGTGLSKADNKLYFAESNFWSGTGTVAPEGGFRAYQYDPRTGDVTRLGFHGTSGIGAQLGVTGFTAIQAATDDASSEEYVYFGTATGLFLYHTTAKTWFRDTNASATGVQWDSLLPYKDALYYCSGKCLYKRTPLAPYGNLGTHTKIKEHNASFRTIGLEVWQNRLWYGVQYSSDRTSICTSDGVTANEAFQMPDEFFLTGLHAHQGALYIFGARSQLFPNGDITPRPGPPATIGQVWKYTGGVPQLLWEANDQENTSARDTKAHVVNRGTSWGELLVWGHGGFRGTAEERAGIMCYHPATDSLFNGPEIPMDPQGYTRGTIVNSVINWRNSLAISFRDLRNYSEQSPGVVNPKGVMVLRTPDFYRDRPDFKDPGDFRGHSIEAQHPIRYNYLISSKYRGDDDVMNEPKVWLTGRLNVKLPSNKCRIKVYLITKEGYWTPPGYNTSQGPAFNPGDESAHPPTTVDGDGNPANVRTKADGRPQYLATATRVKTINYDASNKDWRVVTFPLKDSTGAYLSSEKVQYAIVLENVSGGVHNSDTPEVDSMEIQWMVAPAKRRQWRLRFVLSDAQLRLNGNANSLTTAQAMADKLELFWSSRQPFYLYEPTAVGAADAAGTPIEVLPVIEGFNISQYRLASDETTVEQEVSLTLIENVIA